MQGELEMAGDTHLPARARRTACRMPLTCGVGGGEKRGKPRRNNAGELITQSYPFEKQTTSSPGGVEIMLCVW